MSQVVIDVEGLGKRYRVAWTRPRYRALRDTVAEAMGAPFRRWSRPRSPAGSVDGPGPAPATHLWALKDVSFHVRRGDVVGIIGRNGAGKSTLLKLLSRITEPTEGRAMIRGRVGSLLEVGTGFHPELTGRENIYLSGTILGMRTAEITRSFDEMVAFAEMERFIDLPVKRYSSGMAMRLAFAVAAHLNPEILIVDEVLAVGDLQFQRKCLGKMRHVSRSGRTVLFVSHNMSAITTLCSRALLLHQGRLVKEGSPAAVVSDYLAAALGASGTATWTDPARSPGTDGFKLAAVSVMDEAGAPVSLVNIEQPIQVRIEYEVAVPRMKFRCVASFYTRGACSFASPEPVEAVREETGRYASIVHIPGNLLSEGEYTVGLSVFASRGKKLHYCRINDVVGFQVYDAVTGDSARGDYAEGLDGVMRPRLAWELRYRGEALRREEPAHEPIAAPR